MTGQGGWVLLDSIQFVNNLFLSLKNDDPLRDSIRRIFTDVLGKLMYYSGCTHGIHLLSNCISEREKTVALEIDHLYVDPSKKYYMKSALKARQGAELTETVRQGPPLYVRTTKSNFEGIGLDKNLRDRLKACTPCSCSYQDPEDWLDLFGALNGTRSMAQGALPQNSQIDCAADELLVIPLSEVSQKLPTGHLGTILLWNNQSTKGSAATTWNSREERLMLASKILSGFVSRLLETRYNVRKETYLPSYRVVGEKPVVIMFTDIRGFTPATEILRNYGRVAELTNFMLDYCRIMCELIAKHGGRVHGLAGDGIMALFGEYASDSRNGVTSAVSAAREMCLEFDVIKERFFKTERMRFFFEREYEPMDFGLGIGINFGPVIFDYFGASGSRVYSPLGDHVNFAQRLETQAGRFDEHLNRMRAPILLSRPVFRLSGLAQDAPPLMLPIKGKPYDYQAYECWPKKEE